MLAMSKGQRTLIVLLVMISIFLIMVLYKGPASDRNLSSNLSTESVAYVNEVDCNPNEPCVYPEIVDFRVVVITYNRAESLMKLLTSLDKLELDGDRARIEVWIDVNKEGKVNEKTLNAARQFKWSRGPTRVHVQKRHVGIYGQWMDTWSPKDANTTELAVILEDDISVSPHIYRWLRAVHRHYGTRKDFMGASLTSDEQKSHDGSYRKLTAPKNHTVFMYKCIGTWGLSPSPRQWKEFQRWFHLDAQPDPTFHPYVPGILPTEWYKGFERSGTADSMWEQWLIYFTYKQQLYTVYNNLPAYNADSKSCLCINRREVGLHNSAKGREDFCQLLSEWKNEYIMFPEEIISLDWSGLAKSGY